MGVEFTKNFPPASPPKKASDFAAYWRLPVKQSQIWNRSTYEQVKSSLQGELEHSIHKTGVATTIRSVERRMRALEKDPTFLSELKRFCLTVTAISLGSHRAIEHKETSLAILNAHQARPGKSKLSVMYRDLYEGFAEYYAASGDLLRSEWQRIIASHCDTNRTAASPSPAVAEEIRQFLRSRFQPIDTKSLSSDTEKVRSLRISGRAFEARALAQELQTRGTQECSELSWELACAQAQLDGKTGGIVLRASRGGSLESSRKIDEGFLWGYLGNGSALRSVGIGSMAKRFLDCVDTNQPIFRRLELAFEISVDALNLKDPGATLLILAALHKWLTRTKQIEAASFIRSIYGELSGILSSGNSKDILGCIRTELNKPVATGFLERSSRIFSLSSELAVKIGLNRVRRLLAGGKRAKRVSDSETDQILKIAGRHLSELKGPLMKVGQHLSYLGIEVSEDTRTSIAGLQSLSPSIPFQTVQEVLESELKLPLREIFAEFDPAPIGAGSIGQVHRARLKSGQQVAVKVQYPGIRDAVESDVKSLQMLLPLGRIFSPRFYDSHLIEELRQMLQGECDYLAEARNQNEMRDRFQDHPTLRVPLAHVEICTSRVLITDLVEGQSFRDFSRSASRAELARAGNALAYYFAKCFLQGFFNTDPHPGNFLFKDGQVHLLDFGSVKRWNPDVARAASKMLLFGTTGDSAYFRQMVDGMGLAIDKKHFDYSSLREAFLESDMMSIQRETSTRLSSNRIRKSFHKMFGLKSANIRNLRVPAPYVFGFRLSFSYLFMIAELGAEIDARQATLKALEECGLYP